MARLNSWLSTDVMYALGWALIHSLWQCLALAALAALLMAFSHRPSVRYIVGVGALAAMLAVPVATLFALIRPAAMVQVAPVMGSGTSLTAAVSVESQAPAAIPNPVASGPALSRVKNEGVKGGAFVPVLEDFQNRLSTLNLLPWLVAAWLSGVSFFSLRFAGGFLLLEHKRRSQSTIPDAGILALCRDVQRQLGLDRAIPYLECRWLQAPAVIGWLRPIVLLPVSALTGLTEAQLRAVIAHELAHIRRFDAFVNLFQILVETLLFYHPAVWWLNRRIRAERELACDEIAVTASGSRLEYARAIALMAEWEAAPRLAMAANRGPVAERVLHILGRKSASAGQRLLGLTGSILFLIAALAAANALFAIAASPIAQAKESVKAALTASQATVDHLARQVFRPSQMTASFPPPGQTAKNDSAAPAAAQPDAGKDTPAEKLAPPPADLSRLPPSESIATPTLVAANAPATTTNDLSAASPRLLPKEVSAPESGAASNDPLATPPKFDPNEPYDKRRCDDVPNNSVRGRVTSSTTIQMPRFTCVNFYGRNNRYYNGAGYCFGYGCLCKNRATNDPIFGRVCPPLLTMTVQLANPADASKMPLGKLVTLKGDFFVITQNKADYLFVKDARVLYVDPFDRRGAANSPEAPLATHAPTVAAPISGNPVVMPDTPSSEGDPNTVVCRAPQRFVGNDRLGPQSCGYNYEWAQLMAHGKDLAPDGKTVVDKATVANPTGEGNPDAVTCRAPQDLGGPGMRIRHYGPKFCQTNRFWADLIRNHKQLTADGKIAPESFRVPQSNLNRP